ncbi:MAG: hypothetical protein DWI00_09620 [Planctomycetota bacterium]|nr:MAG: hypothetical protein DWI00_09620 [Planctomycetota bacterium]
MRAPILVENGEFCSSYRDPLPGLADVCCQFGPIRVKSRSLLNHDARHERNNRRPDFLSAVLTFKPKILFGTQ